MTSWERTSTIYYKIVDFSKIWSIKYRKICKYQFRS